MYIGKYIPSLYTFIPNPELYIQPFELNLTSIVHNTKQQHDQFRSIINKCIFNNCNTSQSNKKKEKEVNNPFSLNLFNL